MTNKKIIIPIVILGVSAAIAFGTIHVANAQTNSNMLTGLAEAIAQKFNLNPNDVQSLINQYGQTQRADRQAKMQQIFKSKLDALVTGEEITGSQETAIINELQTLKNQNKMSEFNIWLKSQNIDPTILKGVHMFGRIHGRSTMPSPTP